MLAAFDEVISYTERRTREAIKALPDGEYTAEERMEGDGTTDEDIPIKVSVTIEDDEISVDFSGTSDAVAGNVNCPLAVTRSACYFALRVLLPGDVPANAGTYAPLSIHAPRRQPGQRREPLGGRRGERRDQPTRRGHRTSRLLRGGGPHRPGAGHDEQPDHRWLR